MAINTPDLILKLAEADSSKRVKLFKSTLELCYIVFYSVFIFKNLKGDFSVIDPSKFQDVYQYFISGTFFYCLLIILITFILVKYAFRQAMEFVNMVVYFIAKRIAKPLRITVDSLLKELVRKNQNGMYEPKKYFKDIYNILKSLHVEPRKEVLARMMENVSLIIQSFLIFILFLHPKFGFGQWSSFVAWCIMVYAFLNQLALYTFLVVLENQGYKVLRKMEGFERYYDNYVNDDKAFSPDRPIVTRKQNLFSNREAFSRRLRTALLNYKSKDCLVISINGEWGDGTSSIINLTLEPLIYNREESGAVFFFNPWNLSGTANLLSNYLNELRKFLKKILGTRFDGDVESRFALYTKYVTLGNFSAVPEKVEFDNDIENLKREINRELRKIDFKVIIIIDDIDRLDSKETLQILKLVKSVGDFPNLIYILPFDKKKVVQLEGIDNEYLEKIIQIEIDLPPVSAMEIQTILTERLKKTLIAFNIGEWSEKRWVELYSSGLRLYVKNLRDVNRLINSVMFYLSNEDHKDLNVTDLITIIAIRVFDYKLYDFITLNKSLFIYVHSSNLVLGERNNQSQNYKERLELVKNDFNIGPLELPTFLAELFPNITSLQMNMHYSNDQIRIWRREHRICSNDYFDQYFLYPIRSDKMKRSELELILKSTNDKRELKSNLKEIIENKKFDFFIDRFLDYLSNPRIEINKEIVIVVFLSLESEIEKVEPVAANLMFSLKDQMMYIVAKMLEDSGMQKMEAFITKLYKNKGSGVSLLMDLYVRICHNFSVQHAETDNDTVLNSHSPEISLYAQKNLLVDRLRKSFWEMCKLPNMGYLIYWWRRYDPGNTHIDSVIERHIDRNVENFLNFFDKLKTEMRVTHSHYGFQTRKVYDIDFIKEIVDIDVLRIRVERQIEQFKAKGDLGLKREQVKRGVFTVNSELFLKCLSGEINFKNTEWYKTNSN